MAKDSKRDDGDPTSDTARRRKVASSLLRAATPVSTTLDAFIARANEELQDVAAAPFKPEHREGLLLREIDELKAKLATGESRAAAAESRAAAAESRAAAAESRAVAAETRAAAAEVGAAASEARAASRGSARWGTTIAAFLVGGAAMFALSFVLPGKPAVEPVATSVAAPVVTAPTAPTVTPLTPPAPVTAVPIVEPGPVPVPVPVARPPAAVPESVATPDKVTRKPVGKPRRPAAREDSAATPKPPEDDLYNPF